MVQNLAFYVAFILYAVLSSPTPDVISWPEYIVAAFLMVAIGLEKPWISLTYSDYPAVLSVHRLFLFYMVCIPTFVGAVAAHAIPDIIRDLLPVTFLIFPMIFYIFDRNHDTLLNSAVIIGTVFSVRYCLTAFPVFQSDISLLYLANSPLVPFSTIIGFHLMTEPKSRILARRIVGLAIAFSGFYAMALMEQRAPLALCAMACIVIWAVRLPTAPIIQLTVAGLIAAALLPAYPYLQDLVTSLNHKTVTVGWNNRIEEFQAVLDRTSLLGSGWGALWQSPAVADVWVRFTHNIFSYYLLKTGIIGGIFVAVVIMLWGWQILKTIRHHAGIGLAIAVPFLIHVTLYSGFKTLDFAIILALAITQCRHKTHPRQRENQS